MNSDAHSREIVGAFIVGLEMNGMQERRVVLRPPDEMMAACSRPLLDRRLKPHAEQAQKCPRCDSTNTKFCYYNNYSLSQPRYFCKTCRRYWTKGGTLRNVPVGGGCRKNKRIKRASDQPASSTQSDASPSGNTHSTGCEGTSCPSMEETSAMAGGTTSASMFYGIEGDHELSGFGFSRPPVSNSGLTTLDSLPLPSLTSLQSLKTTFPLLEMPNCNRPDQAPLNMGDFSCIFDASQQLQISATSSAPLSHMTEGFGSFSVHVDGLNGLDQQWRGLVQQQQQNKVALPVEDGHLRGTSHVNLLPFDENVLEGFRQQQKIRQSNGKADEGLSRIGGTPSDWQVAPEGFFETGGDSAYWNGGGTWPDLSVYGPSSSPLIQESLWSRK